MVLNFIQNFTEHFTITCWFKNICQWACYFDPFGYFCLCLSWHLNEKEEQVWAQLRMAGNPPPCSGSAAPPGSEGVSGELGRSEFSPPGAQRCSQPRCPSPEPGCSRRRWSVLENRLFSSVIWKEQSRHHRGRVSFTIWLVVLSIVAAQGITRSSQTS